MKITALAPWFGGKRTMAPLIVRQLGPHKQYFEPFCGSMAVLFAKEPSGFETVNDFHKDLTNLAWVLQSPAAPCLYDRAMRTLVTEELLEHAEDILSIPLAESGDRLDRAFWYLVASWMGRNGVAGTATTEYQLAVRWTPGGGSPSTRWASVVESIPWWHQRLRNVVILNRDAFGVIPRIEDASHTAIYVDPPYPQETRGDGKEPKGAGAYLHEFRNGLFNDAADEHERLAAQLNFFTRARVVVSTYDCERYRELYKDWTFLDCKRTKNLHQHGGRGTRSKEAPEVLIVNGPEFKNHEGVTDALSKMQSPA